MLVFFARSLDVLCERIETLRHTLNISQALLFEVIVQQFNDDFNQIEIMIILRLQSHVFLQI